MELAVFAAIALGVIAKCIEMKLENETDSDKFISLDSARQISSKREDFADLHLETY